MSDSTLLANTLASAVAGIVSRLCTHPLDTAKARMQALYSTTHYQGPIDALLQTARAEGIRGLYRGLGAVIVGGTPGTVVYLTTYEASKNTLSTFGSHDFVIHFTSGMIAETLACIVYVPVDVVKERMQVQRLDANGMAARGAYKNSWDALQKIARAEGLAGVYRGYAATLGSFGPFSALYFMFYEKFKFWTRQQLTGRMGESSRSLDKVELPFQWVLLCSASAGAAASWLTSPLDMAKLRLQISRGQKASGNTDGFIAYRGVADCLMQAYRQGGTRSLFRGAGARVLHFAPATTATMTCYETCRTFFSNKLSE